MLKKNQLALVIGSVVVVGLVGWWVYSYTNLGGDINPLSTSSDNEILAGQQDQGSTPQQPERYELETVVEGLVVPWSIVFPSVDRWLVAERDGAIRVVLEGKLQAQPLKKFVQVSSNAEEGLMGMVLDPNYSENKLLYVCFAYVADDGDMYDKVVRLIDVGAELREDKVVIDKIPAARFHAGCELGFGPDGKLYVSTGDATDGTIAQDQNSLGGKFLRINADGSIPSDNPFSGSLIYSLGHRNPQGFDWHPESQRLYATEHGPSGFDGPLGGDEINFIEAGHNYGWPDVSHKETGSGFDSPLLVYTPAVAPASAVFYTGEQFPSWQGSFFFATLKGEAVYRLRFDTDEPRTVVEQEKLTLPSVGRIREITQGPDGFLYITTSNRDGRGSERTGDDKVYRLVPTQN